MKQWIIDNNWRETKIKRGNCIARKRKQKSHGEHQQTSPCDESSSSHNMLSFFVIFRLALKDIKKVDAHRLQYFIDIIADWVTVGGVSCRSSSRLTFRSGLLQLVESISDFWFALISSMVSWRSFSLSKLSFFSPCIITRVDGAQLSVDVATPRNRTKLFSRLGKAAK